MYLDVISYMLTVLTFSVGFLSTRRHAHFDVLSKDLADRSWKIRQALNAGEELGPRDLVEDVAAVTVLRDSVTRFTRVVNAFFFASVLVVFLLGILAPAEGNAVTLLVILFASTALVFALGEFDVRWMETRERDLASGTVLGQLAAIDGALRSGNGSGASDEIARIREAYPRWAFGRELQLALSATEGVSSASGEPNPMELLQAGSALYAAPLLVAEAQLQRGDAVGALQDFDMVVPRSNASQTVDCLRFVLELAAGLPRAVFLEPDLPPLWLGDQAGLDLGLRSFPGVRGAAETLDEFGAGPTLAEWMDRSTGSAAWLVARAATVAEGASLAAVLGSHNDPTFRGALNSLGIVALARGRDIEALHIFEAAIRIRPDSSTGHWGRAVACARRGWQAAAGESLARAESLDPSSARVLAMTRAAFAGRDWADQADHAGEAPWSSWEAIQLALLGNPPRTVLTCSGARGELVAAVLDAATKTVKVAS